MEPFFRSGPGVLPLPRQPGEFSCTSGTQPAYPVSHSDFHSVCRKGGLGAEADGTLLEILALVDVPADGTQVELVVVRRIQVVVGGQVAFGVDRFRQLRPREHVDGLAVPFFLGLPDEGRVHVRRLVNLAVGPGNEVQVARPGGGCGHRGLYVAGLHFGHQGVFQADVDQLGRRRGLEQPGDLRVALFPRCLGKGRVLGVRPGFTGNGGLEVVEGAAHNGMQRY